MIDLIRSYRIQRSQFTSEIEIIEFGVSQGSSFGPLLFIIYLNDIDTCCNHLHSNLYADDRASINHEANDMLNAEMNDVSNWVFESKLYRNIDETEIVKFSKSRKKIVVKTNMEYTENVSLFKY